MYGDYFKSRPKGILGLAIERITDLEDFLVMHAAKGETYEIIPMPGDFDGRAAISIVHIAADKTIEAYAALLFSREEGPGRYDIGFVLADAQEKITLAHRNEAANPEKAARFLLEEKLNLREILHQESQQRKIDRAAREDYDIEGSAVLKEFTRSATAQSGTLKAAAAKMARAAGAFVKGMRAA